MDTRHMRSASYVGAGIWKTLPDVHCELRRVADIGSRCRPDPLYGGSSCAHRIASNPKQVPALSERWLGQTRRVAARPMSARCRGPTPLRSGKSAHLACRRFGGAARALMRLLLPPAQMVANWEIGQQAPMSVTRLHATDDMLRSTPRRPAAARVAADREWGATGDHAPACKRRQFARSGSGRGARR